VDCYTKHAARPVKTGQAVCLKHVGLRNIDRALNTAASSWANKNKSDLGLC